MRLPGVIHSSAPALRPIDLDYEQSVYTQEFCERMQMVFNYTHYGIVAENNPELNIESDVAPFVVSLNQNFSVTIQPGVAITKSGFIIRLPKQIVLNVPNNNLTTKRVGAKYVLCLEYKLQGVNPRRNATQVLQNTLYVEPGEVGVSIGIGSGRLLEYTDLIKRNAEGEILSLEEYKALASDVLDNCVLIAVLTIEPDPEIPSGTTPYQLFVDMSNTEVPENRPWFTPVDIEHRSKIGSGIVTDTNIHGLGINDLLLGNYTILDVIRRSPFILSKPVNKINVPGFYCSEDILLDGLNIDDAYGTKTGYPNALFAFVSGYPLGGATAYLETLDITGNPISVSPIPALIVAETNIIAFPPFVKTYMDKMTSTDRGNSFIKVTYIKVSSLEPMIMTPTGSHANRFNAGDISTNDLVISEGMVVSTLSQSEISFSDAGPFLLKFVIMLTGDGELLKVPQVIYCANLISNIGVGTPILPEIQPKYPSLLYLGLTGVITSQIIATFTITGYDTNGDSVVGKLTLDSGNYIDYRLGAQGLLNPDTTVTNFMEKYKPCITPGLIPLTPLVLNVRNIKKEDGTDAIFASISSITIDNFENYQGGEKIALYAIPYNNVSLMHNLIIASVFWDGTSICGIQDGRNIRMDLIE